MAKSRTPSPTGRGSFLKRHLEGVLMTYMIDLMRDAFRRAQAEREHLKWVKSSAEALSCNQSFFIANWAEYTPRKIVPLWNAVCLSVRIDAESKAISSEKWIRQMAPHATGATETLLKELLNRYDEALHDARKPGSDLKTVGESHKIKLLDFLEWASKNSWALPDGFPGTLEPVARAGQLQAVPVEAAPVVEVPDPERRLAALRALGGSAKWKRGRGVQVWQFTGIQKLVAQEKTDGRKRIDEKTIRADLREAAEAENMEKRNGQNK